jgi:hypothetical protein
MTSSSNIGEHEWTLKEWITAAPVISTSFAFAFNVGNFFAIDISWFTLFSLSEHVVFALRAIPVAIAGSIFISIAINFPQVKWRPPRVLQFEWWPPRNLWPFVRWFITLLAFAGWIALLFLAAVYAALRFRFALSLSFVAVAAGSINYVRIRAEYLRRGSSLRNLQTIDVLYWTSTIIFITFIIGYTSAYSWVLHNQRASVISYKGTSLIANLILSGQRAVLIYQPVVQTQSESISGDLAHLREELGRLWNHREEIQRRGAIRLILWHDIKDISLCPESGSCQVQ